MTSQRHLAESHQRLHVASPSLNRGGTRNYFPSQNAHALTVLASIDLSSITSRRWRVYPFAGVEGNTGDLLVTRAAARSLKADTAARNRRVS